MGLARHFFLRITPFPVQSGDLLICLQQNPNETQKAPHKGELRVGFPSLRPFPPLHAVHLGRETGRQEHKVTAESG